MLYYLKIYVDQVGNDSVGSTSAKGVNCYAGRGAVQLSWNYNYKFFSLWLYTIGITDENGEDCV
jgi:hypothetical protein